MGTQKVKAAKEEKAEAPEKRKEEKKVSVRKWKGKDWFTAVTSDVFAGNEIGDIPATDPQSLIGRKLGVSLSQLTGNPSKYYIKLNFRIGSVDSSKALAEFDGLSVAKEQIFRIVRKRTSRVDVVRDVSTKDGWLLHMKIVAVLNKSVEMDIQRKVRAKITQILEEVAPKSDIKDFIKTICEELLQKNMKKFGSKIYPVRFCEVAKIEVKKKPASKSSK